MLLKHRNLLVGIAIAILSVLIYGQVTSTTFGFQPSFSINPPVNVETNNAEGELPNLILETFLSFGAWGVVGLFAITGVFCFVVLLNLLHKDNWPVAAISSLLFVAHPVHTEVVAYAPHYPFLISLFFGLFGWLIMLIGAKNNCYVRHFLGAILIGVSLILLPSNFMFVLLIPLSILWFTEKRRFAIISFMLLIGVFIFLDRLIVEDWNIIPSNRFDWSFGQKVLALGHYLKLTFWPTPLSIYYGNNALPFTGLESFDFLASASLCVIYLIATVWLAFRRSIAGFGLLFLGLSLIPFSNVLWDLNGLVLERGLLTPSIGVSIFVASTVVWIRNRFNRWVGVGLLLGLIITISLMSFQRLELWQDTEALMATDLKNYPQSANLLRLNGERYFDALPRKEGNERHVLAKKALECLLPCSRLEPTWQPVHLRLALIYDRELNQPYEAIPHYERSLSLHPKGYESSFGLAGSYAQIGMQDSAVYFIKKTLDIYPEHFESLEYLTSYYFQTEQVRVGSGYIQRFIQFYPQSDVPHLILSDYFFKMNEVGRAVSELEVAASKNPVNKETLKALFDYYYSIGDTETAEKYRDIAVYN